MHNTLGAYQVQDVCHVWQRYGSMHDCLTELKSYSFLDLIHWMKPLTGEGRRKLEYP